MENFLLFFGIVIVGVIIEITAAKIYFRLVKKDSKINHHSFRRYVFLLTFPLLAVFVIVKKEGLTALNVFLVFSIVGTFLEWLIGFSYHKVVGQRLWTYHKYSLTGYSSLLSIPLWGMAGVLFWLLAKALTP